MTGKQGAAERLRAKALAKADSEARWVERWKT